MKKFFRTLILLGLFLILSVTVAVACPNKTPICHHPPGQPFGVFNYQEVAKNGSVNGHDGHSGDIIPVFTYTTTERQCDWELKWGWYPEWRYHNVEVEATYPGKNLDTIYGGEWTGQEVLNNHCVVPPPSYKECSITDEQPIQYGSVLDVGLPVYDPWQDNGDGTFTADGTQATTQSWSQEWLDSQNSSKQCAYKEGTILGERDVEKTEDGSDDVAPDANCSIGYATKSFYDPDKIFVRSEYLDHSWLDILDLEETTLFGVLIKEPVYRSRTYETFLYPSFLHGCFVL